MVAFRARFSDTEIDLFFHIFKSDPFISQLILDEEEVKAKEIEEAGESRVGSALTAEVLTSAVSRKLAAERRQSMMSTAGEEGLDDLARPKSGRSGRQIRSARIKADHRAEQAVEDKDFHR